MSDLPRRVRRDLDSHQGLYRLYTLTARLRSRFTDARIHYRDMDRTTRPVEGASVRAVNRDGVINALANRCFGLTDSIMRLCRAEAYDDAYALGRVGLEAVTHLEFLTRDNWRLRIDTYASFLDAHHVRLRDVFFGERATPRLTQTQWDDKERRVVGIFGEKWPESWRVFRAEHLPDDVKVGRRVSKGSDLFRVSFKSEFVSVQSGGTESFLLQWVYPDTSGYVHTDATSLHASIQQLSGTHTYRVEATRGGPASRHALMLAVTLQLATVNALEGFTGVSCEPRLSQLSNRLARLVRYRNILLDSLTSTDHA